MTDQELSYKAEAEFWKDQYLKVLAKTEEMRKLQKTRAKMKNWFPGEDKQKLYAAEKALDKKIEQCKEELKTLKMKTLFE